jgi:autotransporter-associated beta strand protein
LELGASEVLPDAATLVLGGFTSTTEAGTLSTGFSTGYSETAGSLRLNANSTIALGSGSHTLSFAGSASETWLGTTLTISNWLGTAGSTGTAGRIFFGSDATGLTAAQLNKISFLGFMGAAMLLPSGELVPAPVNPTYVWNPTSGSADFQVASNWTPARTVPGLDDLLGFTAGGSSVATNVPTQSIGRLIVANNTSITLQPSGAGRLLTIQGGNGSDLIVASGSTLTIGNGANSLGIQYFGSGLTAAISGNMTISSSNTANSYNSSSGAQTFINGGTMNVGGTLSGNLINNGTVIFNRPSGSYTYSDIISGTGLLDKQGSAVLIFGGSNTYSGETLISAGTLMLGTGGILPTGTALTVSGGAILDLNGSDGRVGSISGAGVITNSATGGVTSNLYAGENGNSTTFSGIIQDGASAIRLSKTGIGNLNLAGNNTYTGGTLVIGGVISLGAGGTSGSVVGNVDMGSSIYLFTSSNPTLSFNRSDDITYAGVISGMGTVTKQGANTVSLTGDHTYTGTTICSQGRLSFGNGGTTGSLTDGEIVNDAIVAFNRSDSYIFNGFISGAGLAEKRGTGTVGFTNNQTYSGLTNIIGGTLSLGNNTTGGSVTGNISIQTTGRALVFHRSNDITYPGVVSSTLAGTVTTRGSGVLYLTGANTYSGNTVVNSGTLSIGAGGTTGSIANSNIVDSSVVIFDRSDAITYSRVISGPGAMRKQGAGTLTVSGANTYTGATFATAGILQLSGNERISNFSRIELSGGTLRTGNGNTESVATLTLGSNSTLALGGTTVHNLNFSNSSAIAWSSGTTLTITGWQGIPGASGTGGKVFFGSASGTLSAQQLSQIVFQGFTGSPVLLSSGELVPRSGFAWLATSGSADWQTPSSWNPARTSPLTSDVLVFPNGGSSIATNVPTQTVAQILMFGNTAVTLEAASSANTLTMQGSTGNDLSIPLGSSFTIGNGANAMAVNFVGAGNATNVDGTLSLSNGNTANNFNTTNSTVLVTGTFNIGGSVTGNFANNGLVNFTGLNAYSHPGIISGTGAVTVSGTGPVTITGENTYTGLTTINSGSSLTVGDGSTAGTIAGSSGIANSGTLTFNHSDDYTYSNPISGTGTVNQVGTGLLTLDAANNQSGNFAISSGSLALGISSRLTVSGDFNATGTLIPNSSTLAFTGSSNSTISGNMSLYNLELNKSSNSMKLSLGSNISVSNELNMVSGDLDLNGSQLDLGNTGSLINETAANCVTGTAGGSIRAIRTLNAPSSENIAGLGAVLSSAQNLGSTEIIRRHNQVVVGFNYGMNRRYEIHPTNNSGLNATFVFQYFDGELITPMGTFNEADLLLWRYNGSAWEDQGGTVDVAANTITKTGIPQFSEWTSGSIDVPLPISLTNLKVSCGDLYPQLSWNSIKEENTGHFTIETSVDGQTWTSAGELPAGRKSKKVNQYSFNLENLSRHAGYVRLVLENLDGSQETFGPLSVICISPLDKEKFNLFPNPSSGTVTLDLQSLNSGNIQVRVLNTVGEEVMQLLHNAVRSNKIKMDMKGMPAGIYQVLVGFEGEGKMQTLRLVVQ